MRPSLLLFLALVAFGCNHGGDVAGTDAGVDLGTSDVDAGSGTPTQTIDDVTFALGVAAALAAPLAPDGSMLQSDATANDMTAHTRSQHGFSGSSVVTPMGCATYSWTGLMATVTLAGCTLEALGQPISGSVSLGVMYRPSTKFTVTFTNLMVGTTTFDGNVALTMHGTDAMPLPPTLDVDLTFTGAGTSNHLTATGVSVTTMTNATTMMLASVSIAGTASLTSGTATTMITAAGLTWNVGDCLPSSGTLTVTTGTLPTHITFLASTPMDGKVTVQVASLPSVMEMLFTACP